MQISQSRTELHQTALNCIRLPLTDLNEARLASAALNIPWATLSYVKYIIYNTFAKYFTITDAGKQKATSYHPVYERWAYLI